MYQLIFSNQTNLSPSPNQKPSSIYSLPASSDPMICLRQDRKLAAYKYVPATNNWLEQWDETIYNVKGNYPFERYPWFITDKILPNVNIIVLRHPEGIKFYRSNDKGLEFLKVDNHFHEVYNYQLLWGQFFPNTDWLGFMARNNRKINFYAATPDSFDPDEPYPLFPLTTESKFSSAWSSAETDFFATKLYRNGPDFIGLRTTEGLEFYKFNNDYLLEKVLSTSLIIKPKNTIDRILFANLTNKKYQEILQVNSTGLYIYQYNDPDYKFLNLHRGLSQSRGWSSVHSESIQIFDLNEDGRDDLIYTGPQGLSAETFELSTKKWETLIDSQNLYGLQKYGTIVGTLSKKQPILYPSVFLQDTQGKIQWGKVVEIENIPTTSPVRTTVRPTLKLNKNAVIPNQTSKKQFPEKPTQRWVEQWPSSCIKEPVDIGSGQVHFTIPLTDIFKPWGLQFALTYNSQDTSDLLGVGWTLPLAQDYIFVDHQGSIYFEDFLYYLMVQGRPQRLKYLDTKDKIKHFKMEDENLDITFEYHQLKEYWVISSGEKAVYGKSNDKLAEDALQFSLGWPNWNGPGTNKAQQQFVTAWYLNTRLDEDNKKKLYYFYEIEYSNIPGGRSYTSALRLKSIRDNRNQITFHYSPKNIKEYKSPNPVDEKGNIIFPAALSQSHFLDGCTINAATYLQKLRFNYDIRDDKRLLSSMDQLLPNQNESILQMTYEQKFEKSILQSLKLAQHRLNVNFTYGSSTPPSPTVIYNNILRLPVRDNAKIAYGSDYSVIAFKDLNPNGRILLRITNREMTRTIVSYLDETLICPPIKSKIKDFIIQSYKDFFMVVVEGDSEKILYVYKRQETWSKKPFKLSFSKEALIHFSEDLITAVEPGSRQLKIWKCKNQIWEEVFNQVMQRNIKRLALHGRLLVTFDDNQLILYYLNNFGLHSTILESNLQEYQQHLNFLDLETEIKTRYLITLNQNGLQIFNNQIQLSVFKQNGGQLSTHVRLYLLDSNYQIVHRKSFVFQKEYLDQIKFELKENDSTLNFGYFNENGVYRIKVESVSGNILKDIDKIRNRNKKQDEMDKLLNEINNSWTDNFKKMFLINFSQHKVQINQQGVSVSNDMLLRNTGLEWQKEYLPSSQTVTLGEHFILESDKENKLYKLYRQDDKKNKQGPPIKEISLESAGNLINFYPAYIAYQLSENSVKMLTFDDEKTLGKQYTFNREQLLQGSDWQNLVTLINVTSTTVHAESKECLVRPITTLISTKPKIYVNKMVLSDGQQDRRTGYQHSYSSSKERLTFSETVVLVPGANEKMYGKYEATRTFDFPSGNVTKSEKWFDGTGQNILGPPTEDTKEEDNDTPKSNPSLLMDSTGEKLISDFSPYNLADEMVAYYGFEDYETGKIGSDKNNKTWRLNKGKIIKEGFAFTGLNYLQLQANGRESSFLEGTFEPNNQHISYLASCWIRSNVPLSPNTPISFLKAKININIEEELVSLLGQIKYQLGDWFYVELPIDFQIVKQIYENYTVYNSKINPAFEDIKFKITLRLEATFQDIIDVDHIRFTPFTHEFEATVYDFETGKTLAIIQNNGLVVRNVYNHLQQEIANINEDSQLTHFFTASKTGHLTSPSSSVPCTITIEPEYGFYETFDNYSLRSRWKFDDANAWNVSPGKLWHKSGNNRFQANENVFDNNSAAIRFYLNLKVPSAFSIKWKGITSIKFDRQLNDMSIHLPNRLLIKKLPHAGEILVLLEENYVWLWFDGVLLLDQEISSNILNTWQSLEFEAQGEILLEDFLVMNQPQLKIEYNNDFGEKSQVLQLEDKNTVLVTETLYDELGREAITTKTTRIKRVVSQSLLRYRQNFVTNKYNGIQSVWFTDKLLGEIDILNPKDQGVPYMRTEFASNPLNEEKTLGLPSPDYSITGSYATRMSQYSEIAFLDNLFPSKKGFRQKVEYKSNGSIKVSVFDKKKNQVAIYIRVPSYNHLLSTYEYDTENRLIKILPPLYHEKAETSSKTTSWQNGEGHLSTRDKNLQLVLATWYFYDKYGNLIRKITPDTGTTEFLYNSAGLMRFMYTSATNHMNIIYFEYDSQGQLIRTGKFNQTVPRSVLEQWTDAQFPNGQDYQQFDYSETHSDPLLRARIKHCITYNEGEPVAEKLQFNNQDKIVAKSAITVSGQAESDELSEIKTQYVNGKIHKLIYPKIVSKPFELSYTYNKLGQLTGLGIAGVPNSFASFTYYATGELESEKYIHNNFTRKYQYNSPGFLDKISDTFLTEDIAYSEGGYGQSGYGDGMIMKTTFRATWANNSDGRWFQIQDSDLPGNFSTICIKALKRTGYLTENGQPIKEYTRETENRLPLVCGGETSRTIAKLLAQKQAPGYYGHSYTYGNHQELVKAKYFYDKSSIGPLQQDTFAKEILKLSNQQSRKIWQLLVENDYVINDQQRNDSKSAIGKRGKSFFNEDLFKDLKELNSRYTLYFSPIQKLVISAIIENKVLTKADFESVFLNWEGTDHGTSKLIQNNQIEVAGKIAEMLITKGYLAPNTLSTFVLDKKFTTILQDYSDILPDIIRVLSRHFAHSLGEHPFDIESFNIDPNGNHHSFYTGFDRYELFYRNNTNQIQSVKFGWSSELLQPQIYSMEHDEHGNVIQALHKGIKSIEYNHVSQRTTRIELTDGRTLRFYYDAQGERILKRVFSSEGKISQERHYLRDEQGRVLADRLTVYSEEVQNIVTVYIYGPRGLIGFLRNNKTYIVTTDHAGSVRLVSRDGEVVAAYDYLPYGEMMREFGNAEAQIVYRYTGQEFDEETGLYNYHARLYDPIIGRFYQPDPKAQYFSPYKYAGNSPISTIDPDGEFAFLIACLVLGIVGAYVGGAAANNRWNPADWDFSDPGTWLGMFGGGVAGGLLPVGFAASVTAIGAATGSTIAGVVVTTGLGLGGTYLMTAASTGKWNPLQWEWDRPHTWSAMFQGFGAGSGIAGGIGLAHNFAKTSKLLGKISSVLGVSRNTMKVVFLTIAYSAGGGISYTSGVLANNGNFAFWQWDWSNPATWSALIDGFDTGMGWPQNIFEISRGFSKMLKNPKKLGIFLGKNSSRLQEIKAILKNPSHPLYKVSGSIVMGYFMGSSAACDLDISKWDLASFSTYEGILNGVFFGKDTSNMLKYGRGSKTNHPPTKFKERFKNMLHSWPKKFANLLDSIHNFRTKIEYQKYMLETFASEKVKKSVLDIFKDRPTLLKDIEHFYKTGIENWKKGKNRVPKNLKDIVIQTVDHTINSKSKALTEWKVATDDIRRKQHEIYLEEGLPFLNCGRRRKRQMRPTPCNVKREMIARFTDPIDLGVRELNTPVIDGYQEIRVLPKSNPRGFSEHFRLFLDHTPNFLATTKPEFFPNTILGALWSSAEQKNIYVKVDVLTNKKEKKSYILKTGFKTIVNGEPILILKTFIIESKSKDAPTMRDIDAAKSYSKNELTNIARKLRMPRNYKIQENVFKINQENKLFFQRTSKNYKDYPDLVTPDNLKQSQFVQTKSLNLKESLDNISSNDIEKVEIGVRELSKKLLNVYPDYIKKFGFVETSEATFHAFFYGALSFNFKNQYSLDIHVERIAGRGYADLMFISRKGANTRKNWRAIPVLVEFKADKTSSAGASDQVSGTGYLYNLGLRTIATEAIVVGINSVNSIHNTNIDQLLKVERRPIQKSNGFIKEIIKNFSTNVVTRENVKILVNEKKIRDELKHLYYSISPLTNKSANDLYLSRLILGEIMSRNNVDIYIGDHRLVNKKDQITTIIFNENSQWIMLNLIESSKETTFRSNIYEYIKVDEVDSKIGASKNIPEMGDFVQINIEVNPKSKNGWSSDEPKRTESIDEDNDVYYYQGTNVEIKNSKDFKKSKDSEKSKDLEFIHIQSVGQEYVHNILSGGNIMKTSLEQLNLEPIKKIINNEAEFQALLHGLMLPKPGNREIVKVFPEINPSKEGRIDLAVSKLRETGDNTNSVEELSVAFMELKISKDSNVDTKLKEAVEQIKKYTNEKMITDLKEATKIAVVFDQKNGEIKSEVILDDIAHTSDGESSEGISDVESELKQLHIGDNTVVIHVPQPRPITTGSSKRDRTYVGRIEDPRHPKRRKGISKRSIDDSKYKIEMHNHWLDFENDYLHRDKSIYDKYIKLQNKNKMNLGKMEESINEMTEINNQNYSNWFIYVFDIHKISSRKNRFADETEYNKPFQNLYATSGANDFKFWPATLIKKVGSTISSIFSFRSTIDGINSGLSIKSANIIKNAGTILSLLPFYSNHDENTANTQFPEQISEPDLLEIGDRFVRGTEINGLLLWGILLVRKWSGTHLINSEILENNGKYVQFDIQSMKLVENFVDSVESFAETYRVKIDILENSEIYFNAVKAVRQKLITGEIEEIPKLLYKIGATKFRKV